MDTIILLIWVIFLVIFSISMNSAKKKKMHNKKLTSFENVSGTFNGNYMKAGKSSTGFKQNSKNRKVMSSDGHKVSNEFDRTCETQFGHNHRTEYSMDSRYVVHEEPTQGYIVLNGKKYSKNELNKL